jgi:hypothetical protein
MSDKMFASHASTVFSAIFQASSTLGVVSCCGQGRGVAHLASVCTMQGVLQ